MNRYVEATPLEVNSAREYLDSRPVTKGKINVMELVVDAGVTNTLDARVILIDWFNDQLFEVVVPGYVRIQEIVQDHQE